MRCMCGGCPQCLIDQGYWPDEIPEDLPEPDEDIAYDTWKDMQAERAWEGDH